MDRSGKTSFLTAALAMAMAGVFAVACDSGTQEPAAPDHSAQIPSSEAANSKSHTPTVLPEGTAVAVPEEFPAEVPIYPGAVPTLGKGFVSDGVPTAAVQFQTTDSPEQVFDFYTDKLSREGWTIEDRESFAGKNAVAASKGKCTATMMAAPSENGGTDIFMVTEC